MGRVGAEARHSSKRIGCAGISVGGNLTGHSTAYDERTGAATGRDTALLHGLLFVADKCVEKLVEFLRRRIVGFAKIVIQAAVVAVALALCRDRNLGFLQHGFEAPRLSSGVGIAGEVENEERRDAFVLRDVRHR